ncbi:unnamed protein product [Effrenium voratum]|uniref:Ubiquitin-like domain-containing protein n=1 Tax=Effrenium voratum TaxID=2562239 RepID=A0AA36JFB0_9DINO|nr:unnamed protein product [Effrenium voratum]
MAKPAARRWPKVRTFAEEPQEPKQPADAWPVEVRQEPFALKRAILLAHQLTHRAGALGTKCCAEMLQVVLPAKQIEETLQGLVAKTAPASCTPVESEMEVQVLRLSGSMENIPMNGLETILELKAKLTERIGVPGGWQVLLREDGLELVDEEKLGAYFDSQKVSLRLQVFKLRDVCREAVFGKRRHAALWELLAAPERGTSAAAAAAGKLLTQKPSRGGEENLYAHPDALRVLARTLPLIDAGRLMAEVCDFGERELQQVAAEELARIFYEDSAVAAALRETAGERHLSKRLSAALLEAVLQKPRPRERPAADPMPTLPSRDVVDIAQAHCSSYLNMAKRMPNGWHFKSVCPTTVHGANFRMMDHLATETARICEKLQLPTDAVSARLSYAFFNTYGASSTASENADFVAVWLDPGGLFPEAEQTAAELWCAVAELHRRMPAEHTRMALECAAQLAGPGDERVLAAACWTAGHQDAAVRDQALEALQRVAKASQLPAIEDMLQRWWAGDCHARRISAEIKAFLTS